MDSERYQPVFTNATIRAAAFIPNAQVSAKQVFRQLPDEWLERFDKDPVILPLDANVPAEIARMILQSTNGQWRFDMSLMRYDVFWNYNSDENAERSLEDVLKECCELLIEFKGVSNFRIGRLACVVHRIRSQADPGKFLADHFCQEEWLTAPFNRPENFELHSHKKFSLTDDLRVNSWVRNKTAIRQSTDEPVVLVEQDLNTLAEESAESDFSDEDIRKFFSAAGPELDRILSLYYPGE